MSGIRRWLESLRYVPGYQKMVFVYLAIIILVILSTRYRLDRVLFPVAYTIIYSGLVLPLFLQSMIGKLSQRAGWWIATVAVIIGFYIIMRLLVALDLLGTGLIYQTNIYGIIWTAAIACFGIVGVAVQHGLSGLRENLRRDLREISTIRQMTKGEPLILDRRTIAILVVAVAITAGMLGARVYLLRRPDFVTRYAVPANVSEDLPKTLGMTLWNRLDHPVNVFTVAFSGYFRYPAETNYTGSDLLELAKSIGVVAASMEKASGAPPDMVLIKRGGSPSGNMKQISIDLSKAFAYLGLYENETSHLRIPSKFIIRWDRKEKKPTGVWVGTPGVPFMMWQNATRMDGRGRIESTGPYKEVVGLAGIELKDVPADSRYGFNLTGVFHPWLGEEFREYDELLLGGEAIYESGKTRELREVTIRKIAS